MDRAEAHQIHYSTQAALSVFGGGRRILSWENIGKQRVLAAL